MAVCLANTVFAQELKFDYNLLDNPTTDKRKFESYFKTLETKQVKPRSQKNAVALENG